MDDVLNQDMSDAIAGADLSQQDKELIRSILFAERSNKNRQWDDDDAVDHIIGLLKSTDSGNDSV